MQTQQTRTVGWPSRMLSLVLMMTFLIGCVEVTRRAVACGTNAVFTQSQQEQIAQELSMLPQGSLIRRLVMPDWLRMRDENRACMSSR